MTRLGTGAFARSGQAQRGQVFAGSPTEANFVARESFYYNALESSSYPTAALNSTFFVLIVTFTDDNFGR
jgi:hypothetical protein